MWKILNNKSTTAYINLNDFDRKPITASTDSQLDYLRRICEMFKKMAPIQRGQRIMTLTSETRNSLVQTLTAITEFCEAILDDDAVKYVLLGNLQSDDLEGEFGVYRGMFGGLYHISVEQILIGAKFRLLSHFQTLNSDENENILIIKHSAPCCTSSISDDELQLVDDIADKIDLLTIQERNALFYVAGYITKKEHLITCEPTGIEMSSDSEFLSLVSRGKLTYPSSQLFNYTLCCYAFFSASVSDKCLKRLTNVFSFLHDVFLFDLDRKDAINVRLVNTFCKGFVRKVNDINMNKAQMKKLQKLKK